MDNRLESRSLRPYRTTNVDATIRQYRRRKLEQFRGTTILSVRRGNKVVIGGDGQVSQGNTILKGNARKVRRLYQDKVLAGFAGGTADAFKIGRASCRERV